VKRAKGSWFFALKVLRWLCIIPLFYLAGVAFWLTTAYLMLLYPSLLDLASRARIPPQTAVSLARIGFLLAGLCVFALPIALYVGFLLHKRVAPSSRWAFFGALLLLACFVWVPDGKSSSNAAHTAAVAGGLIVFAGVASSVWFRSRTVQWSAALLALVVFTIPTWLDWAKAPAQPPVPLRLWSTVLQPGTWQAMNTGSEFAAKRQLVFAKDRIVAVFDVGYPTYEGRQPMSLYRLVSMNLSNGNIVNTHELKGRWGDMPYLFATSDEHVVLSSAGGLQVLNPDLSQSGPTFTSGKAYDVSPDGSTLAVQTAAGTTLLDANTLAASDTRFHDSTPNSTSRSTVHGECGSRPNLLSNSRVLLIGCGEMRLLDTEGHVLALQKLNCCYAALASVSQDGRRFAIHFKDEKGDPAQLLYEQFVIYEASALVPIAMVSPETLGERQSWSALSPDGKYFACGNPDAVSVYQLPASSM
jgi:hypothetical protein